MSNQPNALIQELPGEFPVELVWAAIQSLLKSGLGPIITVDCIGTRDFDEDGAVTVTPPAARVLFLEESARSVETQFANYDAIQNYAVLCAAEDVSADPQAQRTLSAALAGQVKHWLTGARLVLGNSQVTEPVAYKGMGVMETAGTGMAYVVAFQVAGIAQFAAPNAQGFTVPQGGQ